jgi:hypothetical protein
VLACTFSADKLIVLDDVRFIVLDAVNPIVLDDVNVIALDDVNASVFVLTSKD